MQNKETKKIVSARKQHYIPYAVIAVFLVACIIGIVAFFWQKYTNSTIVSAQIGNQSFVLEVAETQAEKTKGLSERDSLPANTGMLFDFGKEGDWRIWMLQMRFPIDIAWLDANKTIVHIKDNATPAEYPEVYKSEIPSRYVIEVPSGTFKQLDVKPGDSISFFGVSY